GNIQSTDEIRPAGLDVTALVFVAVGIGNGMDEKIDAVPLRSDRAERFIKLMIAADIAGHREIRADAGGQRPHTFALCFALIGEGKLGAVGGQHARNAPGDGMIVRDTHDDAAPARHQIRTWLFSHGNAEIRARRWCRRTRNYWTSRY